MLMTCCDLQEAQEQTISRFISGSYKEITDLAELQPYAILGDMITLVVKTERQRQRHSSRVSKPYTSSSYSSYVSKIVAKLEEKKDPTKVSVVKKGKN